MSFFWPIYIRVSWLAHPCGTPYCDFCVIFSGTRIFFELILGCFAGACVHFQARFKAPLAMFIVRKFGGVRSSARQVNPRSKEMPHSLHSFLGKFKIHRLTTKQREMIHLGKKHRLPLKFFKTEKACKSYGTLKFEAKCHALFWENQKLLHLPPNLAT